MPSRKSAHYGRLAEEAAQRKYAARPNHSSWHDIEYRNGTKADVKSAVHKRGGRYGRFRLWEEAHEKLLENGGGYVFAIHASDSGKVLKLKRMSAREVQRQLGGIDWRHSGHEGKDSKQLKVPWPKLF